MFTSRRLDRAVRAAAAGSLNIPVELILSADDRIIDNTATQRWLERVCGAGKNVRTLSGHHTLEFERDAGEFLRTLADACRAENGKKS